MERHWLDKVLDAEVLALGIPIVAILVGGTIAITGMIIRHRERIAMIEHGMQPPKDDDE
jgi:hypothetical protein